MYMRTFQPYMRQIGIHQGPAGELQTCVHTRMYTHTTVYICMYVHLYTPMYIHKYMYINVHTCMLVHTSVRGVQCVRRSKR